jgi:hypothetical protein
MSIEQHPLYKPQLNRTTAEEHVRTTRRPILRKSSIANHYAITTLISSNNIVHYLVQQRPTSCAVVSESGHTHREFPTVDDMIQSISPLHRPHTEPVEEDPH